MELWEQEYREKLEAEIPDGYYKISNGDEPDSNGYKFCLGTGKGGYINYLVEIRKQVMGFEGMIRNAELGEKQPPVDNLTEKDVLDFMETLRRKADEK
jgi:hypothetical protein